jgi:hypothetical protein
VLFQVALTGRAAHHAGLALVVKNNMSGIARPDFALDSNPNAQGAYVGQNLYAASERGSSFARPYFLPRTIVGFSMMPRSAQRSKVLVETP